MNFMVDALIILFVGFCLMRVVGKKTVGEMTGLEIVTLLAIASNISHAVAGNGLWKTIMVLCVFVGLLVAVQYLSLKFDWVERCFLGKATLVVQDGKMIMANLKKLRLTVDQLEARLREKGISRVEDLRTVTMEISGQLGYEWKEHAKPVTIGDLEKILAPLHPASPGKPDPNGNLFDEVAAQKHRKRIPRSYE
ncbi:DUF421 domain-containing protein [Cohnella sp. REN36]|uniref:DUF421 domain-containing protein n=1 Tax=Cohnella sp. REN36 TaxID=2887347 RepID=UPI001D159D98|nr:YetF domain-containing protein [Cohnella sp. REN36]MCC3371527.1 DUF421 domain-containing protein [Cohnella sp. REN36]